jgi:hypothetical protein
MKKILYKMRQMKAYIPAKDEVNEGNTCKDESGMRHSKTHLLLANP